jgi:hypothetical protein
MVYQWPLFKVTSALPVDLPLVPNPGRVIPCCHRAIFADRFQKWILFTFLRLSIPEQAAMVYITGTKEDSLTDRTFHRKWKTR